MDRNRGLVCAYLFDGNGAGREIAWEDLGLWQPETETLWLHFEREAEDTERWLDEESGIAELACEALISDESSPRVAHFGDALLIALRGVNTNPGADAEDLVSVRVWAEARRIITVRRRPLVAIKDIRADLEAGRGPVDTGQFLTELANKLVERMGAVINDLEDEVDALEDSSLTTQLPEFRTGLNELRRTIIALRRYLSPQREALSRLQEERVPWLSSDHRVRLRESAFYTIHLVDDLNAVRDRTAVLQDELKSLLSDQMNRTMFLLALVSTILLPLSFVTGLLGINVGGIPGADYPWAFVMVAALLLVLGMVEVWVLRRLKWI